MQADAAEIGVNLPHSANVTSSHLEAVSLNSVTTLLHSHECSIDTCYLHSNVLFSIKLLKKNLNYVANRSKTCPPSQDHCSTDLPATQSVVRNRKSLHSHEEIITPEYPKQKITAFARRNNYPRISETENHCIRTKK